MESLKKQVGGDHYRSCSIQPIEFINANKLGFLEGCVIKRLTRHRKSTGKGRQDIKKAIHELQLLDEYYEALYPNNCLISVLERFFKRLKGYIDGY